MYAGVDRYKGYRGKLGDSYDGYIIRWDAVASDLWTSHRENGFFIPDRCLNFLTDRNNQYLYCTPLDHPNYLTGRNIDEADETVRDMRWRCCVRYRYWEPSMDEIVGLVMGYDFVYRLVGDPAIRGSSRDRRLTWAATWPRMDICWSARAGALPCGGRPACCRRSSTPSVSCSSA